MQLNLDELLSDYPTLLVLNTDEVEFLSPDSSPYDLRRYRFGYSLALNCSWNKSLERLARKYPLTEIIAGPHGLTDLSFLHRLKHIRRLMLRADRGTDLRPVESLKNLVVLRLYSAWEPASVLNLCALPELRACAMDWWPQWSSVLRCGRLQFLRVWNARKVPHWDLKGLSELQELELLRCHGTRTVELAPQTRLASLAIRRCRCFESVSPPACLRGLKYLWLEGQHRLDIKTIARFKDLVRLWLDAQGKVPSLAFLKPLKKLKRLEFEYSTNILDGDLEFLTSLPNLERVNYHERRHYRPAKRVVQAAIERRTASTSPAHCVSVS